MGGGSVHWAAFTPRFHPSDFEVYTRDGVGADWPISYWDLKPYYELLELEMPVAGPRGYPWGDPHGYAFGPHPMGGVGNTLIRGCTNLGIGVSAGGPVAILSGSRGRPAALHLPGVLHPGLQGGRQGQHADHPRARCARTTARRFATAAWSRASITISKTNRVTGVSYFDREGRGAFPESQGGHRLRLRDRDAAAAC